jgi:hypothetical protein
MAPCGPEVPPWSERLAVQEEDVYLTYEYILLHDLQWPKSIRLSGLFWETYCGYRYEMKSIATKSMSEVA